MPKVQNVMAPAPKNAAPKPAKDTQTLCGVSEFKRRLADARKKDDAPANAPKPEQSAKPKRAKTEARTGTKQGDAEAVDTPTDATTEAGDGVAKPAEEVVEEQPVAENPETEEPTVVANAEDAPTPAMMIAAAPTQAAAIADDGPVIATAEVEQREAGETSGIARPAHNIPMKSAGEAREHDADDASALVMPTVAADDPASDEDVALEALEPATPAAKHVTKPTPAPAAPASALDEKPKAQPKSIPAALEALEQAVAGFDASQPEAPTDVTTKVPDGAAPTSVLPSPTTAGERSATAPQVSSPAPAAPAPVTAQSFAEVNHPKIVTSVRGELLPTGGTMQIRLDPPELGALQVLVHMRDGAMTASFQTTNDDATRLLSHSLGQLKQVLESQGVSVDKLHVQQAPRDQQTGNDDQRQQQHAREDETARHEQQRKEMLRRMWRRLSGNPDPLDLVA